MKIICSVCGYRYPAVKGETLARLVQAHQATHDKQWCLLCERTHRPDDEAHQRLVSLLSA